MLLTDGEDNTISSCFNEVKQSGAVIHTVALGPSAAKELEELSKMTGEGRSAAAVSHWIAELSLPLYCELQWTREKGKGGLYIERGNLINQLPAFSSKWPLELTLPISFKASVLGLWQSGGRWDQHSTLVRTQVSFPRHFVSKDCKEHNILARNHSFPTGSWPADQGEEMISH